MKMRTFLRNLLRREGIEPDPIACQECRELPVVARDRKGRRLCRRCLGVVWWVVLVLFEEGKELWAVEAWDCDHARERARAFGGKDLPADVFQIEHREIRYCRRRIFIHAHPGASDIEKMGDVLSFMRKQ